MNFAEVKSLTIPEGAVVRILSGDTVLWNRSALPQGYTQKTYVQTDGGQYIDTGVLASDHADGIRYTFCGNPTQYLATSSNNYLWGCYAGGSRTGNPTCNTSTKSVYVIVGNQAAQILVHPIPAVGEDFTLQVTATSQNVPASAGTLNGENMTLTTAATAARNVAMPAANIWLFWVNGLPTATKFCGRLYAFTMDTADGVPIRCFVPCVRDSDGEVGLYDTVQGRFYQNVGTGAFTCG